MFIENWKMDYEGYRSLDCTVPCDMYSVLLNYGYISDPYYGTNEKELFDYSKKDCVFYSSFSLTKEELKKDKIDLIFYGIDTICDIYLNGTLIGNVMNMHRKYEYDIKNLAKENNILRLEIKSPVNYFYEMNEKHPLYMSDDTAVGACHLRKAFYMSGWDWAPKLPNMGIFRPVQIICYNVDKFEDVEILQHHEENKVLLDISTTTKHGADNLTVVCEIEGQRVQLKDNKGTVKIENPRLWWPNGYGEQNLYEITFYLYRGEDLIDTLTKTIGLRTLSLCREDDEYGQEFCYKINGVKMFAMGANFVPVDSLPSRMTNERLEKIVNDCIFSNFNTIRVWGGAFYPEDYLYDLCDKYGLIVWQDFMVACANVWLREDFVKEFSAEAVYNVKRLRHHACLGILCGNNEMEEAICNWPCADGKNPVIRQDYLKLYEEILPKICKEYAPQISYTPSSPTSGGNFDLPTDYTRGDVHFWHVWNGDCEFDEYRKHKFRFCSEYGFESLPNIKTIDAFCPDDERNLLSYTMESHQKHWHGNVKLLKYLAEQYQAPRSLEAIVYASQLNQATAIKFGVEHFRRCRGYTMGSIYWQLNDCWPVASWSSIDYFGRYKALHYFAKKFYQATALGLFNEGKEITINVANEAMSEFKGYVEFGILKNDFDTVFKGRKEICVPALSSLDVHTMSNSDFNDTRDSFFFCQLYSADGTLLSTNTVLGTKPKHFKLLNPQVTLSAENTKGGVLITATSKNFAKNVEISFKNHDIVLSDNYFDLVSTAPYTVFAKTDLDADTLLKDASVFSVYDIALY